MSSKPKLPKMIYIEFDDPQYSEGWSEDHKTDERHRDIRCEGIGIELDRTKEYIRICMAQAKFDSEADKLNTFKLPRSCIKRIRRLDFKRK